MLVLYPILHMEMPVKRIQNEVQSINYQCLVDMLMKWNTLPPPLSTGWQSSSPPASP